MPGYEEERERRSANPSESAKCVAHTYRQLMARAGRAGDVDRRSIDAVASETDASARRAYGTHDGVASGRSRSHARCRLTRARNDEVGPRIVGRRGALAAGRARSLRSTTRKLAATPPTIPSVRPMSPVGHLLPVDPPANHAQYPMVHRARSSPAGGVDARVPEDMAATERARAIVRYTRRPVR